MHWAHVLSSSKEMLGTLSSPHVPGMFAVFCSAMSMLRSAVSWSCHVSVYGNPTCFNYRYSHQSLIYDLAQIQDVASSRSETSVVANMSSSS